MGSSRCGEGKRSKDRRGPEMQSDMPGTRRDGFFVPPFRLNRESVLLLLGPRTGREQTPAAATRWWPDWKSPLIWLLGLSFGCNNSIFFGCNGLLPDYLTARGESHLVTPVLTAFNGAQLVASFILLGVGERLYGRAWPFVVFGVITLGAFPVLILAGGAWIVVSAAVLGF